jgi:hypothetical protein
LHDQRADQRADNRCSSASESCATNDDGGDRIKLNIESDLLRVACA